MDANMTISAKENRLLQTAIVVPATMTLVCFLCTIISMTVAAFICLRDREAKDEQTIAIKQQRQDEFVSKTITQFYTIRAFNVFRIHDIISDKNDHRPSWVGSKEEIVRKLHRHGISLTDKEDREISTLSDVFEIDAEALFYFEMERFAKTLAMYGDVTLSHYSCIAQDGMAFPNLFLPEKKPIFQKDLIHTIFKEMRQITDLFVLLLTGIEAGYLKNGKLPKQLEMCLMKEELTSLENFFYNYYQRIFSPQIFNRMEKQEAIEMEAIETMQSWQPDQEPERYIRRSRSIESVHDIFVAAPIRDNQLQQQQQQQGTRSQRTRQMLTSRINKVRHSIQSSNLMARPSRRKTPSASRLSVSDEIDLDQSQEMRSLKLSSSDPDLSESKNEKEGTSSRLQANVGQSLTSVFSKNETIPQNIGQQMQKKEPKLVQNPWSNRRRGKLKNVVALDRSPFTYMVFRVLETLKGNNPTEEVFKTMAYYQVDKNFIV